MTYSKSRIFDEMGPLCATALTFIGFRPGPLRGAATCNGDVRFFLGVRRSGVRSSVTKLRAAR
jgi:hypothetical protein